MPTVVIIGATGMLGRAAAAHFAGIGCKIVAPSRAEFDIAKDAIAKLEPWLVDGDAAINCAGVVRAIVPETPVEEVLRINSIFPRNFAGLCERWDIPCVHISTDAVFDGARGSYTELDPVAPTDLYGLSKCAGETRDCMVVRTSLIGEEISGRGRSLISWAQGQAGKQVHGFTNQIWNGMTTLCLAQGIESILFSSRYRPGIFHVHSPEAVTKFELLTLVSEIYELSLQVNPAEAAAACNLTLRSIDPLASEVFTKPLAQQLREMRVFFAGGRGAL